MQRTLRRSAQWALAAVCLGVLATGASAGTFTRGCAARDLQILMLIEERGTAISAEKTSDAMFALMHARVICSEGQVLDALALYDSIAQSITANPVRSKGDIETPGEWWRMNPQSASPATGF